MADSYFILEVASRVLPLRECVLRGLFPRVQSGPATDLAAAARPGLQGHIRGAREPVRWGPVPAAVLRRPSGEFSFFGVTPKYQ